jgi:hypothetical protein
LSDTGEKMGVHWEVLYNILTEFSIPVKPVTLIRMSLNETYSKICIGERVSDASSVQNSLKGGGNLSPLFFTFSLEYAIRKV